MTRKTPYSRASLSQLASLTDVSSIHTVNSSLDINFTALDSILRIADPVPSGCQLILVRCCTGAERHLEVKSAHAELPTLAQIPAKRAVVTRMTMFGERTVSVDFFDEKGDYTRQN